ncbi:DNA-binding NtrC family response regulator [Spirosoma oryzae]|uniref:DNA-binding NtrC family response regulator n=1 Tax=Spirosoma oryzae TaxID=1469603 RepID=A0A2T0RM70_9BACT|nr:sigma-54 dependent transcriptional regulator [Spirosoma oryzae]PRY22289.1 DNA-binding NtrC family response regulator [Spirosoma oryzae]
MKLLISWYAYQNDFDRREGTQLNENGPTMQFHEYFYEKESYDKHILLSTAREKDGDLAIDLLTMSLQRKYPERLVEPVFMDISDPIDIPLIRSKVEGLLLTYREADIDIFFSPGTSAMQVSWYSCHTSLGLKTRLLQTRASKFLPSKKPELLEIQVQSSSVPYSAVIAEQKQQKSPTDTDYLVTKTMEPLYERARLVAQADGVTCLLVGESGTGKEHIAQYIHRQSARANRPFIAVNCSALNDQLLESRLFGYVKGAFTDAKEDRSGYFVDADGGTLFLDEIGDISPYMQQLLLRVLQEREISPIGTTKSRKVNVRILAATHRDLESMCADGAFRWDLFYRLAVVEIPLPSLQTRGEEDKKALLAHFLKRARKEFRKPDLSMSREVQRLLLDYSFPGNVRELENVVTNMAVFNDREVTITDLPARLIRPAESASESLNWEVTEKNLLIRALQHFKGNQRKSWQAVGYKSLNTFRKKLKDYGINE